MADDDLNGSGDDLMAEFERRFRDLFEAAHGKPRAPPDDAADIGGAENGPPGDDAES